MTLSNRERDLVAVGVSAAAGCKPCTESIIPEARRRGASDVEITQAVIDAVRIRRIATENIEAFAMDRLGKNGGRSDVVFNIRDISRTRAIVLLGAAFAVNDTTNVQKQVESADQQGLTGPEVAEVLMLADYIKAKAASHVEALGGMEKPAAPCPLTTT